MKSKILYYHIGINHPFRDLSKIETKYFIKDYKTATTEYEEIRHLLNNRCNKKGDWFRIELTAVVENEEGTFFRRVERNERNLDIFTDIDEFIL